MRRGVVGVVLVVLAALVGISVANRQEVPEMAMSVWEAAARRASAATGGGGGTSPLAGATSAASGALGAVGAAAADPVTYYDQPYDSGMGAYAAPPPRELASSPEWLAYLNALGVQEQGYRADTDRQRALYQSEATRQLQDLPAGYIAQRRGITGSLENRGMARSGELLRRLAENRANQGRAESTIQGQLAFQQGSLESQLAQKLIELNAQRAQQEMNLRAQGYV